MTSIPAPAAPRRSYRIGYRVGAILRRLPFGVALASWGGLWILLLVAILWPRWPLDSPASRDPLAKAPMSARSKFVQIAYGTDAEEGGAIYALDDHGRVWFYNWRTSRWEHLSDERERLR